jgi:hypothetical protein
VGDFFGFLAEAPAVTLWIDEGGGEAILHGEGDGEEFHGIYEIKMRCLE